MASKEYFEEKSKLYYDSYLNNKSTRHVRGIIINDEGQVLLLYFNKRNGYSIPGGTVEENESIKDTVLREVLEETGADIKVGKLLWTEECFWEWNGTQAHNIAFYYLIELADGSDIPDTGAFVSHKDNCNVVLGWMPIEKLTDVTIYPDFIKETIYELDEPPRHFITRE